MSNPAIPNTPHAKIMQMFQDHLAKKSKKEQREMLASDEGMKKHTTEFYALIPPNLQQHIELDSMLNIAVDHRQKYMKKPKNQKKTFGKVIKKGSSDFSDIDMLQFEK